MFTVEQRDAVHERILELAHADERIVGGAILGSMAHGPGDRWSDLDLSFGLADGTSPRQILDEWTPTLAREFEAALLFDLPVGSWIYRVFLLPGALQVDLSFAPAAEWGARGPNFKLLFGSAAELPEEEEPRPEFLFGISVHHAVRARIYVERGRLWRAEYWLGELRHHALELAMLRHGIEPAFGPDFDALPRDVLAPFDDTLVRSLERDEVLRALRAAIDALLRESKAAPELASKVETQLRALVTE